MAGKKGRSGRPRKSVEELKTNGSYRPSRHGHRDTEPGVPADQITTRREVPIPDFICEEGRKLAAPLLRLLSAKGLPRERDDLAFFIGVEALVEYRRCVTELKKPEFASASLERSRLLKERKDWMETAETYLIRRFGLDPISVQSLPKGGGSFGNTKPKPETPDDSGAPRLAAFAAG